MIQKTNIAILGSGKLAYEYSKILKKYKKKIYACSSRSEKSRSWKKFKILNKNTLYMTNEDILNSPECTHIISCLPHLLQEKYFDKLMKSKKKILIEKPFCFNSKKYSKIIKNTKKTLRNKFFGFNRRYYSTVSNLFNRIKKGDLKYVEVKISENFKNKTATKNNLFKKYFQFFGSSSHIIDLLFYFFKKVKIKKIYRFNSSDKFFKPIYAILEISKNIPLILNIEKNLALKNGINIFFKDDTIWSLSPIETLSVFKGYKINKFSSSRKYLKYSQKKISELNEKSNFRPGLEKSVLAFINDKRKKTNFKNYYEYLLFYEKIFKA